MLPIPFCLTKSVRTLASIARPRRRSRPASAAGFLLTNAATAALGLAIASFQPAPTALKKAYRINIRVRVLGIDDDCVSIELKAVIRHQNSRDVTLWSTEADEI